MRAPARAESPLRTRPLDAPLLDVDAHVPGRIRVALTVAPGERVAVIGPNGAGKSSLAALVAGLLRPSSGHVRLDGRTVAGPGAWVPAHDRGLGMLGQQALLFDHLSVLENVAFGLRARGARRRPAHDDARRWLDAVGLGELADVRQPRLSGGQAARVALARALATRPRLLVLDEPTAALDVRASAQVRTLLAELADVPGGRAGMLLVTHDVLDVLTLADRVVVLEAGQVADDAAVDVALALPRTPFAAHFAGLTRLTGTAVGGDDPGRDVGAGASGDVAARDVAVRDIAGRGTSQVGDVVGLRLADGTVLPGRPTAVPGAVPVVGAQACAAFPSGALVVVDEADSAPEPGVGELVLTVDGVEPRGDHAVVAGTLGGDPDARAEARTSLAAAARLARASAHASTTVRCHADPATITLYTR